MTLRIGTRRSRLAVAQTQAVAELLRSVHPDVRVELREITTEGDRRQAEGTGGFRIEGPVEGMRENSKG